MRGSTATSGTVARLAREETMGPQKTVTGIAARVIMVLEQIPSSNEADMSS